LINQYLKKLLLKSLEIKRNTEALSSTWSGYFFLANGFTDTCCKADAPAGYRPLVRLGMPNG
jgi:hypothetical protein